MTLDEAVKEIHAASRAIIDAQLAYVAARAAVVAEAARLGITERVVLMVGKVAWYIDPPSALSDWPDGWTVSYGSAPRDC